MVMFSLKYRTILTCPCCGFVFEEIKHSNPVVNPQSAAMLGQFGRSKHARESPSCAKSDKWVMGWNTTTEEIR